MLDLETLVLLYVEFLTMGITIIYVFWRDEFNFGLVWTDSNHRMMVYKLVLKESLMAV